MDMHCVCLDICCGYKPLSALVFAQTSIVAHLPRSVDSLLGLYFRADIYGSYLKCLFNFVRAAYLHKDTI